MRPRTLVLDEPTAGLDPRGRTQLARILADVHARGVTVAVVTHSMDDAAQAQQVIVLDRSHVMADGTPASVFAEKSAASLADAGLGLPTALSWALALRDAGAPDLGAPLTLDALATAIASRLTPVAPGAPVGPGEVR